MQRISITNPQNIIDGTAKKYYFKLRNTGGPKGDKGEKGDAGATGPQGPQGDPCTVVVNSTATLEPGSNAYVTNTGSLSNAVLNFGIPKGDRGPQGAKGDKGDTGAQGETGPRGPQGERGTNATVSIGTTYTLNPGAQATVYNSGSDSNAVLNFGIPQGEKGDTGSQGPQGPTGPAGQNFTPTIVAELPATGDSSKLYLTPKAHTTQTATGNPITATITDEAGKMESFQLDGDTFQQTYTGKNLFDGQNPDVRMNYIINDSGNEVTDSTGGYTRNYSKVLPETQYILSGLIDAGTRRIYYYDNSKNYISRSDGFGASTITFTTPANCYYVNVQIYTRTDTDTEMAKWQIEAGSTATAFEPYTGGQPSPSPDYPELIQTVTGEQTVEIVGKNLFDKTKVTNGYYIDANGALQASANFGYSDYISVVGGETYSFSGTTNSAWNAGKCAWYDSNKEFISSDSFGFSGQLTAPANASYFRTTIRLVASSNQEPYLDTYQFERGSTVTTYAPYHATSYPISLGSIELCKLGTYKDYIYKDGENWKVHKATGKYTFDGTEGRVWDGTIPRIYYSQNQLANLGIYPAVPATASTLPTALTTKFSGKTFDDFYTNQQSNGFAMSTYGKNWNFGDKSWATVSDADADITGTTVYYALLSEYKTDTVITDQTLIAQLEAIRTASLENGANTITNSATAPNLAGDMEIDYYGYNPTNRYDKWLWLDINNNYEQIGS